MTRTKKIFLPKTGILFLTLALAAPPQASALRPTEGQEGEERRILARQLLGGAGVERVAGMEELTVQTAALPGALGASFNSISHAHLLPLRDPASGIELGTVMISAQGHGNEERAQLASLTAVGFLSDQLSSESFAELAAAYRTAPPGNERAAARNVIKEFLQESLVKLHAHLFWELNQNVTDSSPLAGASVVVSVILLAADQTAEAVIAKAGRGEVYLLNESSDRFELLTPDLSKGWVRAALGPLGLRLGMGLNLLSPDLDPKLLAQFHDAARESTLEGSRKPTFYLGMPGVEADRVNPSSAAEFYGKSVRLVQGDKLILLNERVSGSWKFADLKGIFLHTPRHDLDNQIGRLGSLVKGQPASPPFVSQRLAAPLDPYAQAVQGIPPIALGACITAKLSVIAAPAAGQEEFEPLPIETAFEMFPSMAQIVGQIPRGANTVWVTPLPSQVNLYAQRSLVESLTQKFQVELPPDLRERINVVALPLQLTEAYQKPAVIFKDSALNQPVENPLDLPMLEIALSDVKNVNPAAVIFLALRGYQDSNVKLLGVMTFQDAQGKIYLAVFA